MEFIESKMFPHFYHLIDWTFDDKIGILISERNSMLEFIM